MLKKHIRSLLVRAGNKMPVLALRIELEAHTGNPVGEAELDQALSELALRRAVVVERDEDTGDRIVKLISV